ncbi:MAG: leucine-rich repeat protein, partial [Aeriscardovia sp.]|nr:leucine-rich repeat protein [Aeriscardovia sp.]
MGQEDILRKLTGMTSSRCTPEIVTSLKPNEVFVFGSNQEGEHKSPAAKLAVKQFGAMMGCGEGLFGQSYAIPVHKHRRSKMVKAVSKFIDFAKENIDKNFLVLTIGCGSAGMDAAFVALMFRKAIEVENIFLPKLFIDELIRYYKIGIEISEDCMTLCRYPMDHKGEYSVPYGIEIIGRGAFEGCAGLDVKLPESLKRIEEYAFSDMGFFDYYLRIPSSVSYIDDNAFTSEYVSPRL